MESASFDSITWSDFEWLNKPKKWDLVDNNLEVVTDLKSDFWQDTYYKFKLNTGHLYGVNIKDNFTIQVCVEADFTTLYDQAGVMIYLDEKHWLKAGIEYNDGQPMIGSVLTNEVSDWATGTFTGNPRKFWIRLSRVDQVLCVKYSPDKSTWYLLRLCPFPAAEKYFVGVMCCSPKREGLKVKFSDVTFTIPVTNILHSD
ncbi:unnamed protein product [Parnassius apollo]|uniref:(apollo) hypothetical protein n=1 Tax=Parnassius apollo TaxID=110799 RepID=A0A8S3YCY9_PARAO|nr:unnamed protein product [Parnassius apollo]